MSGPAGSGDEVAVKIVDDGWLSAVPDAAALCARAARAALRQAGEAGEVSIVLADDGRVAELNARYRGKEGATNVLAFPMADAGAAAAGAPRLLGDVVLARETVVREARAQAKDVADHMAHLVAHGVLHLVGHDHHASAAAEAMEALETAALASLGIADPYRLPRDVA